MKVTEIRIPMETAMCVRDNI